MQTGCAHAMSRARTRTDWDQLWVASAPVVALLLTAPTAICQAMEILGFNETYHMSKVMNNLSDSDLWLDAINAKAKGDKPFGREQWDQLLGHCQVA